MVSDKRIREAMVDIAISTRAISTRAMALAVVSCIAKGLLLNSVRLVLFESSAYRMWRGSISSCFELAALVSPDAGG